MVYQTSKNERAEGNPSVLKSVAANHREANTSTAARR